MKIIIKNNIEYSLSYDAIIENVQRSFKKYQSKDIIQIYETEAKNAIVHAYFTKRKTLVINIDYQN